MPLLRSLPPDPRQVANPELARAAAWHAETPVLILLAAGKGTRFGKQPKCIQPIAGTPLASHTINAFRIVSAAPAICMIGYQADQVSQALGGDNIYVRSRDPAGGTAWASYEAFAVDALTKSNPLLVVSMGDRIVPASIFRQLLLRHQQGYEADLTMLTAIYQPPRQVGKGRIIRDSQGNIIRIVEQRDIDALSDRNEREALQSIGEGNCPLYAVRAATLYRELGQITNENAQRQYYFTDIVEAIARHGGAVRSLTVSPGDADYELLCADVTRPADLPRLEQIVSRSTDRLSVRINGSSAQRAAATIAESRPAGQMESIAAQLEEVARHAAAEGDFRADSPIALGISGGRLRIAFMHPDMGRFFGPAWQMPIGAADAAGREQIVIMVQATANGRLWFSPTNPLFRECKDAIAADAEHLYPGPEVVDLHQYEAFGTRMAEAILTELGYVPAAAIAHARERGQHPPPVTRWVANNLRRPFSLLANAIASLRTLRDGPLGERVQAALGRPHFSGLRIVSTGDIPRGGFSSSSAVTVAAQNAINTLFDLQIDSETLVHLACQAEYGTGVLAGALDQATEQQGRANQGALISSNPRDNYRILRTFRVPAERYRVLFPYSVDRDREAWQWSMGMYAKAVGGSQLTAGELRKMTGKAAEIAAILLAMPIDEDFFPEIEPDLVQHGELTTSSALHVRDRLLAIPLLATQQDLRERLRTRQSWYVEQLMNAPAVSRHEALSIAEATIESLLAGWRDPYFCRFVEGQTIAETGAPLRAMLGYLYGEVVKNAYLVHHPEHWIECVTQSQRGDRCVDIEPGRLPSKHGMLQTQAWEKSVAGPQLMELWLERAGATPFDFNAGLHDRELHTDDPLDLRRIGGTNFFRGLPLIDLAEAMLKRAFGSDAVAVRVNGAGQGDYFQVHVDTERADPEEVKDFIRVAFYRRFALRPVSEFVEPHPGGGAVGVRLDRYDELPELIAALRQRANEAPVDNRRQQARPTPTSQVPA